MKDKSNKQTNAGTAYPLRAAEFTSGIFGGVCVAIFYRRVTHIFCQIR
jgi:hypothetical protein